MARKDEFKQATEKNMDLVPNIYVGTYKGKVAYFLKFKFNTKYYNYKNITRIFGDTTLSAAKDRLKRVIGQLQNGIDPFEAATKPIQTRKDMIKKEGTLKEYIAAWTDERIKKRESKSIANCYSSYKKHMEPLLKDMLIQELDVDTAILLFEKIRLNLKKQGLGEHVLDNIKKIMNPALKRQVGRGIQYNPLEHPDFLSDIPKAVIKKQPLEYRIDAVDKTQAFTKLAQELYSKSLNYEQPITRNKARYHNDLYRAAFLISIMCGRRIEEFIQVLDWKDITTNNLVLTKTKTGTVEEYPLPLEVVKLLNQYKRKNGIVFEFRRETFLDRFNDIINSISSVKFRKGSKYEQHDKRSLIVSIMTAKKWCDRTTADKLISHAVKNVSNTYHNTLDDLQIMEKYWNLLRDVDTKNENNQH